MMDARKIDSLGRVVIPKSIRAKAKINTGDEVDVMYDGKKIIISKPSDSYLSECINHIKDVAISNSNISIEDYDILGALLGKLTK